MKFYRPTWAEIRLNNLCHNFRQIKRLVSPSTKILSTVKADAYGHGLVPVAKTLASCGTDYLGVASIDEGISLRKANVRLPILILGLILEKDIPALFQYRLIPTVSDLDLAAEINKKARRLGKAVNLHIKIDTGMGRIGILHDDAQALIKKINSLKFISIEGVFTHFAFADMNRNFTLYQLKLFNRLIEDLKREGICIPLVHAANSVAVIDYRESHFNMVRPGLVIYGVYPKEGLQIKLKPVLSLKTKVIYVKRVPRGFGISYGHAYITHKPTTIVTLPIGYGDGYPRNLSNCAPVIIKKKMFKVCGRICMDQIMVDVGNYPVKTGDEAILIGSKSGFKISAEKLADLSNTIAYEIVCGLGSRIPRVYI